MRTQLYEAMFVIDPVASLKDWPRAKGELERILKKHGVEIIELEKWADRKLAYPIRKNNRGTYVLSYFKAPTGAVDKIHADCRLAESILRLLIIAKDGEIRKVPPPASDDFRTELIRTPRREAFGG